MFSRIGRRLVAFNFQTKIQPLRRWIAHERERVIPRLSDLQIGCVVASAGLSVAGLGVYVAERQRRMVTTNNPQSRIKQTYAYVAGGLGITTAAAGLGYAARLPVVMASHPWLFLAANLGASLGTLGWTMATPYPDGNGALLKKHLAWATFCSTMGLSLCFVPGMAGPVVAQAAAGTVAMVGAFSLAGATAQSEKMMLLQGPLYAGLAAVTLASFGRLFSGAPFLRSLSLYGGLAVFAGLTMLDTRRFLDRVKDVQRPYDPINGSLDIYLDVLNVFIRMLELTESKKKTP